MAIEAKVALLKMMERSLADKLMVVDMTTVLETLSDQLACFNVEQTQEDVGQDDMLDAFLSAKSIEGRSPKTLARYRLLILKMMESLNVPTREVTVYHIRRYLSEQKQRGLSDRTLESIRQVYSSYFNWLQREGLIRTNPAANLGTIKCEKKIVEIFSDVELELLKEGCKDVREKALVTFLASTGCRIGEIVALDRDSVDIKNRICKVHGKGNKDRFVYFDSVTAMILTKYLQERKDDHQALFVNRFGDRIDAGGLRWILTEIGKRAGVDHVYPHRFRRTCATKLIARGMTIENVAHILGHDKLETTMHYVKLDDSSIHNAFNICA